MKGDDINDYRLTLINNQYTLWNIVVPKYHAKF